nr:unnamed protein product [Callosobruchus chinensis]
MKETKTNKDEQITQSIFYKMSAPLIDEDAATAILKYPKKVGDPWQPKNLQTRWKCIQCDKYYCMICFTEPHFCTK